MHITGHCISIGPIGHHPDDLSPQDFALGFEHWSRDNVLVAGTELVFDERYTSSLISRYRIWRRWLLSLHANDSLHVRVVRQAERSCVRRGLGE